MKPKSEAKTAVLSGWRSYSQSLRECGYTSDADFVCPVCRKEFRGPSKPSSVSKGHIIPAAFGGCSTVLVCKECDDYMGHTVEAPLVNLIKDASVVHGKAEGLVRGRLNMRTDSGPVRAHLRFNVTDGWTVVLPKRGDGEKAFSDLKPGPILKPPRIELALGFEKQEVDRSTRLTVLKAAYLAAFKWLGYAYALRRELAWVGRKLSGHALPRPYCYAIDPPGKSYVLSMPGFPELESRVSHVALLPGSFGQLRVLFGFIQLHRMQFLAILPPPEDGVTLAQMRATMGTGKGRTGYATFCQKPEVVVF